MNTKKRILAWVLTLMMLLTALPVSGAVAVDYSNGYGRGILAQMENAEALLYAYDTLEAALDGTPASISVTHRVHKITWDELCTVYDLLLSDHPEVFWHGSSYSGSLRSDGYAAALRPTYVMTGAELEAAKAALEAEVVRLTADLTGKSDYEKSLLLHDRVAEKATYLLEGHHQTSYGALVQGTAVCAGYSRAYQLLMQRAGIPIWYVAGKSISPWGEEVSHAWNLVLLDGEWYYTDVTWDDQKYTFYAYLNMNSEQLWEDHIPTKYVEYLPVATHTCHNYFVINDLRMEQLSVEAVANVIRNDSPARVYVTGDEDAFIEDYCFYLLDICDALNVPAGSISYGYVSVGREVILQLSVTHTCNYVRKTVAATCSSDGYTVEECSYEFCHNQRNRTVIAATGEHVYDHGCDADCNVCGALRTVSDHTYRVTVVDPTCHATGAKTHVCTSCGYTFTDTIPATGEHVYDNACDTDCNVCGALRTVSGHTYEVTVVDPTCHTAGAKTHICVFCGYTFTDEIPATGEHVYDAACDADCNVCGALRTAADHTYEVTVVDPTCSTAGAKIHVCVSCGYTFTDIIPATGEHVYDDDCDADCNVCGMMRLAPHVYDNDDDAECNVCGAVRPTHLPGDINGDGSVNLQDLGRLMQYVNGWDVEIDLNAVDVNGDGKVNNRDYALLQRYLNGWNVTLV